MPEGLTEELVEELTGREELLKAEEVVFDAGSFSFALEELAVVADLEEGPGMEALIEACGCNTQGLDALPVALSVLKTKALAVGLAVTSFRAALETTSGQEEVDQRFSGGAEGARR